MSKEFDFEIFKSLVGPTTKAVFQNIKKNVQMYVTPKLSLFIPFLDYCDYAISPEHTHPSYSFIYNYTGPSEIKVGPDIKQSPFGKKPNICAFSPNVPHQEIVQEQFKSYIAICISKDFFENELQNYPNYKPIVFTGTYFPGNDILLNTLRKFILEYDEQLPCYEKILHALALEITHFLIRHCFNFNSGESRLSKKIEINQLISYLNEDYARKISLDDMAKYVNLSPSHFSRLFKDETGLAPVDFLINLRIQKAKKYLLNNDLNITEIAFSCGFSSQSYFSNCFFEKIGMSPAEYRKKLFVK